MQQDRDICHASACEGTVNDAQPSVPKVAIGVMVFHFNGSSGLRNEKVASIWKDIPYC